MGSETKSKIPIIELSKENLKPGSEDWISTCKLIQLSLENFGCILAVYDKVSQQIHESLFEATKELFNLSTETKSQETSKKTYHSYFGGYSFIPLYESLGVDNPTLLEGAQKFTKLMWPHGNDHFCESVHGFSKLVAKLEEMVTRMIFDSYGVLRLSDSSIESTSYLLRLFKYRVPEKEEPNLGLHSHIDITFLSLIHQHLIGGLQIELSDDEWIDIEPSGHSCFVVMAGEALAAWSNGRIRPCNHRVVMTEKTTRYSAALFSFKNHTMAVPAEVVDDANPLKYNPFDHFDYIRFHRENSLRKIPVRIKDYCGVTPQCDTDGK